MVIVFGQGHLPDQVQGHGYCFGHVGHVGGVVVVVQARLG